MNCAREPCDDITESQIENQAHENIQIVKNLLKIKKEINILYILQSRYLKRARGEAKALSNLSTPQAV